MTTITSSPTPKKVETTKEQMTFPQAIEKIIEGKRIHKLEWKDKAYSAFLNGEFLSLHKPDGKNYKWIINEGDLIGTDYIVI